MPLHRPWVQNLTTCCSGRRSQKLCTLPACQDTSHKTNRSRCWWVSHHLPCPPKGKLQSHCRPCFVMYFYFLGWESYSLHLCSKEPQGQCLAQLVTSNRQTKQMVKQQTTRLPKSLGSDTLCFPWLQTPLGLLSSLHSFAGAWLLASWTVGVVL